MRDLDDVVAVQAAGYGGGSLIYANVHLRAPDEVFRKGWPEAYNRTTLDPHYDRVAYMLNVRPLPAQQRLRKTQRLKALAKTGGLSDLVHAFDPPLAVTFDLEQQGEGTRPWADGTRPRGACDMRGQCWLGCRQGAKNSLDFNYLRIVEQADNAPIDPPIHARIHLGAEAIEIERLEGDADGPWYKVYYLDHLTGPTEERRSNAEKGMAFYRARHVFLAAGAVNTTELLMRSKGRFLRSTSGDGIEEIWPGLGSRYFPNADSLAAVFDCAEPQDADHGPTITTALLHQRPRMEGQRCLWAIDFRLASTAACNVEAALLPGAHIHIGNVTECDPDPRTELHEIVEPPMFDVGGFDEKGSVAMLVVEADGELDIQDDRKLSVRLAGQGWRTFGTIIGRPRKLEDWFLIEDGGYPTDIEPLLGILRSPLWLRRNRFIEQVDDQGLIEAEARRPAGDAGPLRFPLATAIFGLPSLPVNHPDYAALKVLNQVIGSGDFDSRLMDEIRVKRGPRLCHPNPPGE
ncbi:MAG: hypothetical protein HC871_05035 [Rhizobiales bacterium]|nr:hypothetical protein [Hyphomicrobiales bacterium]